MNQEAYGIAIALFSTFVAFVGILLFNNTEGTLHDMGSWITAVGALGVLVGIAAWGIAAKK